MNVSTLDLNLLPALDALLAERHVTRAARRVGLSQPAMSHALSRLRALLGDPLLIRSGRKLVLTSRAEALIEPTRGSLDGLEALFRGPATFDPKTVRRTIRIAASDYAEFVLLPPLLAHLSETAPGVDLVVRPAPGRSGTENLASADADLFLGPVGSETAAARVHHEALFDERFVCVLRRGHPLSKRELTVNRFISARHAFIAPRGTPGGIVDAALSALGKERQVAVTLPHFLVAPYIVARTDLILTLAERVAIEAARHLPIVIMKHPLVLTPFTVSMVWHERSNADPVHAFVRRALRESAGLSASTRTRNVSSTTRSLGRTKKRTRSPGR